MGIETRKNSAYYYRKRREGRRVVSEYVGGGELGALLYQADRLAAVEAAEERAARQALARSAQEEGRAARELAAHCQEFAALALLAAGYHRHKGTWRRRRSPMTRALSPSQQLLQNLERQAAEAAAEKARRAERAQLPPPPAAGDYSAEAIQAIMKRADRVDASAEDVAAVRALLRERGDRLKDTGGSLRQALDRELIEMQATGLGRELLRHDISTRRKALGYEAAPALEKPLIDHLLLCELRLGTIEQSYSVKYAAGLSAETARFWESRLSAAQRRYLQAVDMLAKVRRVRVELARVLPDGTAEAVAVEGPGA